MSEYNNPEQREKFIQLIFGILSDKFHVTLKCLFNDKRTIQAICKLIASTFAYGSSFYTSFVFITSLTGFDKLEVITSKYCWILFAIGVITSLIHNHEKITFNGSIADDDLQIVTTVKDLFCIRASSYVIPTNTYFRTIMEGDYISPLSVQGAFQLRYYRDNLIELDAAINSSLENQGIKGEMCVDKYGQVIKYPIGTVAKVDHKGKHYYFVAINDVNEFGKPINQEYSNIYTALNGLKDTINLLGHCDDLAIPLIGTGRAAIREATIDKVFKDTVDLFLSSKEKISRKLIVCIRPKDYLDGRVNIKNIQKYTEYRCEFK